MLRCEGGVSLSDIIDVFLPKGWFLPVTPGTRFVTVGGAIANDVHGKNHHCAGTFGAHVRQIGLHRSNDGLVICNLEENRDMLRATIGGLGLTGVIAWADIQLKRVAGPWIDAESIPFQSLNAFLDLSRDSNDRFEYTVAWLDCFAGKNPRGIFFRGNHAADHGKEFHPKRGPKLPFALPAWMLNRYSVRAFNTAYYRIHAAKKGAAVVPYDSFFYPLDSIRQWNLLYGRQGFLQYQCVIPETNLEAFEELLDRIARSGMGSFLGVLKQFGSAPPAGMLSFPRPGLTIALDFAMRGERTLQLMQSLDEIVQQSGGALYPAKDARMSPALFEASFPRWRGLCSLHRPEDVILILATCDGGTMTLTAHPTTSLPAATPATAMKKIVILGATSGIALEVQRQLARRGCELLLVARSPQRLAELQADLMVRGAQQVLTYSC